MAQNFGLSISAKNKQAAIILEQWKQNDVNISDKFAQWVIAEDKRMKGGEVMEKAEALKQNQASEVLNE